MQKLVGYFKAAVAWVNAHAAALLLLTLGAWTGAVLIRRKTNQVNTIASALEVERTKARVKELEAQRKALRPLDEAKANEILRISAEIERRKKRVAELHGGKPWEEMGDDEVRRALREAGL